jgi:serine/threonine protein kinase
MLDQAPQLSEQCQKHFTEPFERDNVISAGSTGIVDRLPCGHVRKQPFPDSTPWERKHSLQDIKSEYEVYRRIVDKPHFLEMIEYSEQQGMIILQGVLGSTLRDYLETQGSCVSLSKRLGWAHDIAVALHSLHASNVIHADVKPENILLDQSDKVYLIDFSGSWIDGKPGSALESVRFFLPRDIKSDSTVQTDIFALGSTLYEMMTCTQPYKGLADEEVEQLFQQGKFPSLDSISCGQIIKECWTGGFQSVDDVIVALQRVQKSTQSASLGN